ncbi:amidohydrolase family protein [Sorangium sp. So ce406]|uniref:amidohydrolase family protein n=1 Tax=Sorangium sp. So ce406 TaxID=3133311 RepID=UPI003F5AF86B
MRDGYRILDADRHVIEPLDLWRTYMAPELRSHAPRYDYTYVREGAVADCAARPSPGGLLPLPPQPVVDGRPLHHRMSARTSRELALSACRRSRRSGPIELPETQLEDMDREGIDVAFLYPTIGLLLLGLAPLDPPLAIAYTRAYNAWLRDFCARDPARLRGVGLMSPHDPGAMVVELARTAALGFGAVVIRPNPVGGRTLGDPAYEPFWAECERRSIAVAVHEGTHAYLPAAGADRFHTRFALHACSHPMEQMMALLALIEGGVLERHPGLRVAFLEAGCGWLPYWLWRLDEVEYRHLAGEVAPHVRQAPSAYFRRQCFVGLEPDEPYLTEVIPRIGEDRLLFGTDYPHPDHDEGLVGQALALRDRLPGEVLRKILWDNPARFYGIERGTVR